VPSAFRPTDSLFPDRLFAPDKYYLITGGLGGLGEKLIEWMESLGARKFLITSRSSTTPTRPDRIVLQTDLLDPLALKALLEPYAIDGVFHLAGMICDKLAKDLTPGDLPQVLNVKTKGLANLGRIFEARTHTYFVAFSSIVALIGNPGQSVYSAANSYMDAYCQKRQARGLPGLSVNLGAIGGCGMIGYPLAKTMLTNGINFTVYHDFFEQLKHCLVDPSLKQVCITDQNWNNLSHFQTRIFRPFLTDGAVKCASISVMESTDQLRVFLLGLLDLKEINMDKNLISYGVDSIMSMEIANWCTGHLGINIKQIDLLQGMSMTDILNRREHQNENGLIDQPVVLKNGRLFSFTPLHGQPPLQVVPVKGQQNTGGLLLGAIGLAMAYYWPMNFFPSTTT
jgi:NAD(P)-dependent dehydrogenase (short-subunit alcohol dehydrogenase family)/aryl carrier-like protein